jgi:hypothetical protein
MAARMTTENPALRLRIEPKEWSIPVELTGMGLTGQSLSRLKGVMGRALSMEPDDVAELLLSNRVVRVRPGKKFFGHTLQREANLPGYVLDPFKAHEIYSFGFARKVAYHDYRQKAQAIIDRMAQIPGVGRSNVNALEQYVRDVMGEPGFIEAQTRETIQAITRRAFRPGKIQEAVESFLDPRNLAASITWWEAISRLGLSPTAWFVNLTQTITNVIPEIGVTPVVRAVRLLGDRSQVRQVDALLRAMDLDVTVPLAVADRVARQWVSELSPLHPLYLFNKVENFNRAVAGLSKYQEQVLRGASPRDAIESARRFITTTHFEYSIADTPALLRGPGGATAFQFKKFLIKEMELIWSWRRDPKKLMRFAIGIQAVGGVSALFNLPPGQLLDAVVGKVSGGETLSERIQREFPRASRGFPGMAGVDIGGSVSFSVPRETQDVFGPAVGDIKALAQLLPDATKKLIISRNGSLTPDERGRAVAQLMPVVVKRISDAIDVYESEAVRVRKITDYKDWARGMIGVVPGVPGMPTYDAATDKLFDPADPQAEAVRTFFGMRSLERSEFSRFRQTTTRITDVQRKKEAQYVQRVVNAYITGDLALAERLVREAADKNLMLTKRQVQDAILDAIQGRTVDMMRRLPPERREELMGQAPEVIEQQLGRFRFQQP